MFSVTVSAALSVCKKWNITNHSVESFELISDMTEGFIFVNKHACLRIDSNRENQIYTVSVAVNTAVSVCAEDRLISVIHSEHRFKSISSS